MYNHVLTCMCTCCRLAISHHILHPSLLPPFLSLPPYFLQLYLTTTVTLLWLWNRTDLNKPLLPLVASLLLSLSYSPLLFYLFSAYLTSGMWYLLLLKLTVGLATGSVALTMFGAMTQQRHGKTD